MKQSKYLIEFPLQITPAFVREAYTLLRQSIIHVEQDDIDFDEEGLEGDRPDDQNAGGSQDVQMSSTAMDESSIPLDGVVINENAVQLVAVSSSRAPSTVPVPALKQPAPRPRMRISHDQYQTLKSLIILHLSEKERETGKGVDKDDLIDWYLESKEDQIHDVEQLEYEKEMITKVLKKMVKVRTTSLDMKSPNNDLPDFSLRMHSLSKPEVMYKIPSYHQIRKSRIYLQGATMFASIIWFIQLWT